MVKVVLDSLAELMRKVDWKIYSMPLASFATSASAIFFKNHKGSLAANTKRNSCGSFEILNYLAEFPLSNFSGFPNVETTDFIYYSSEVCKSHMNNTWKAREM